MPVYMQHVEGELTFAPVGKAASVAAVLKHPNQLAPSVYTCCIPVEKLKGDIAADT